MGNLVRSFRNSEEETAGIVGLVAILVYVVVLTMFDILGRLVNQQVFLTAFKVGSAVSLSL
mgnify:CR=1 FL=1